jgi:exopolysaccharide biosynthesis protein
MPRLLVATAVALAGLLVAAPVQAKIASKRISKTRHAGGIVVTQERVDIDGDSSIVFTVSMPRPGPGRVLEPALADDEVSSGTATTSSVSRSFGRFGTAVAINADLFEYASGHPSGLFLLDGEVFNQPQGGRPALAGSTNGTLTVSRPKATGTLTVRGKPVPFEVNVLRKDGVVLYDQGWGPKPPAGAARSLLGKVTAPSLVRKGQAWLGRAGFDAQRNRTGGQTIPPERGPEELFQGYGRAAAKLAGAKPGTISPLRYRLGPLAADASFAIGGGPILIRDGKVIYRREANREFATAQLVPPDARTAVAQLGDGRILFYVVDRGAGSPGFSVAQVARDLKRRGARTAMAFDSGGSTAVSLDGRLLNAPADGVERPVGNTLVYLAVDRRHRQPLVAVRVGKRAPGDRVPPLTYTMLRPGEVSVAVESPKGSVTLLSDRRVGAGTHRVQLPTPLLRTGRWRLEVAAPATEGRIVKAFTVAAQPAPVPASAPDRPDIAVVPGAAAPPAGPAAASGGGGEWWPWVLGGVVAALALAAGGVALGRRRGRRAH